MTQGMEIDNAAFEVRTSSPRLAAILMRIQNADCKGVRASAKSRFRNSERSEVSEFRVAHASRVLASASRRRELPDAPLRPNLRNRLGTTIFCCPVTQLRIDAPKFVAAGRRNQHARRVRYPDICIATPSKSEIVSGICSIDELFCGGVSATSPHICRGDKLRTACL